MDDTKKRKQLGELFRGRKATAAEWVKRRAAEQAAVHLEAVPEVSQPLIEAFNGGGALPNSEVKKLARVGFVGHDADAKRAIMALELDGWMLWERKAAVWFSIGESVAGGGTSAMCRLFCRAAGTNGKVLVLPVIFASPKMLVDPKDPLQIKGYSYAEACKLLEDYMGVGATVRPLAECSPVLVFADFFARSSIGKYAYVYSSPPEGLKALVNPRNHTPASILYENTFEW